MEETVRAIRDGQVYNHSTQAPWDFVYLGDALRRSPQISLHADGSVRITSQHFTDESTARLIREIVNNAGGTVDRKTWWEMTGDDSQVVKLERDATRYTQDVVIKHGTTQISITLHVNLPR